MLKNESAVPMLTESIAEIASSASSTASNPITTDGTRLG